MQALILSDIHANLEALEAAMAAAPPCELVVNLGDVVGYGANPNEVTDCSRTMSHVLVRGNHDKACTGLGPLTDFNFIAAAAAKWTRETLSPENLEWLKQLPQGPVQPAGLPGVECVHGSPFHEDEYLIVLRDAMEPLITATARITFFGHTHIQGGFSVEEDRWETIRPLFEKKDEAETYVMPLDPKAKYLINPGSIGQPRDGDWRTAFATFDSAADVITFHRIPYELQRAQQKIYAAKLPERLALRLAEGR